MFLNVCGLTNNEVEMHNHVTYKGDIEFEKQLVEIQDCRKIINLQNLEAFTEYTPI